jgi:hypothetical protein
MPSRAMGYVSDGSSRGRERERKREREKKIFKRTSSPSSTARPGEGEEE